MAAALCEKLACTSARVISHVDPATARRPPVIRAMGYKRVKKGTSYHELASSVIQQTFRNFTSATSAALPGAFTHYEDLQQVEREAPGDVEGAHGTVVDPDAYDTPFSWLDSNYVKLQMRSHRLLKDEAKHALQHHFEVHSSVTKQHQACAKDADQVWHCGDDTSVAGTVAPECIQAGNIWYGTTRQ